MHYTRKQTFTNNNPAAAKECDLTAFPMDTLAVTVSFAGTGMSGAVNLLYTADGGSEETVRDAFGVAVTISASAPRVVNLRSCGRPSQLRLTDASLSGVTAYTVTVWG